MKFELCFPKQKKKKNYDILIWGVCKDNKLINRTRLAPFIDKLLTDSLTLKKK